MKLHPYLFFDGRCEEAMVFYKDVLGGKITTEMRYRDAPPDLEFPDDMKEKIMHMTLEASDLVLMACDSPNEVNLGSHAHLSLSITSEEEALAIFNSLAEDGEITMPFADTFWGGRFGMITDKYGIQWMVSSQHKPE